MYWIYLIIFTCIISVPRVVERGILGLTVIQTEQYAILLLGVLAFFLFIIQDRRLKKSREEKSSMQRKVTRMTKDLNNSYTYIGEINRKIDILQHITLGLPETTALAKNQRLEIYQAVMAAIRLFGKSDDFLVRFINRETHDVLKEIKSPAAAAHLLAKQDCVRETQFFEDAKFIITSSSRTIDGISACIVIHKKNSAQVTEDPEILKTIATQALFLFMLLQYKNPHEIKSSAT